MKHRPPRTISDAEDLGLPTHWQIPAFEMVRFENRKTDLCIVVPVINEGDTFLRQLEAMASSQYDADIIVADGGSTDGSTSYVKLQERNVSALLKKTGPGGLSAQLRMAFAYALSQGYSGIVTIDGNGKDGIDAIPAFIQLLQEGAGFIQGSRYLPGGVAENTPIDRAIAVKMLHSPLLSFAAGFKYTDTTNGFRGFSARLLRDERVAPFRDIFDTYNLHFYISVRAARLDYRVVETPVRRSYPAMGKIPTKIGGFSGRLHILKQLLVTVIGGYNPIEGNRQ